MISLNTVVHRDSNVCYTQFDDEIVLLNTEEAIFYHFNDSAANLWTWLEVPKTVLELTQMLAEKYVGHPDEYLQDVLDWAEDTRMKRLLK